MMWKALPFTMSFLTGLTLWVGMAWGGWATFLTPLVVFLGLPLVDGLVGQDTADTLEEGASGAAHRGVVRLWAPAQALFLGSALAFAAWGEPTPVEWVGLVLSAGLVSAGGGINAAHELMHRPGRLDRALAEWLMTTVSYTWFCVEHVHGHHRHVGTPRDPASARRGESVYAFYPRTVLGGLRSAVALERARIGRLGIPWYSPRNRIARYAVELALIWLGVGLVFGGAGLAFFAAQAWVGFSLLEVVNYVEHYGLRRERRSDGRYEPVRPRHSWNANHRVSNWWLFNLQRHADHHAVASRPYYRLRAIEEGPQLPFSYPTAILVALVPPLWRAVIHPRLEA